MTMRIGELAKKMGVNPKTIRYYEEIGLMPPAPRTASGYRQYDDGGAERLEFVRSAQALGIALEEIKEILAFRDRGTYPCPYVLSLMDQKVQEMESRIRGLQMLAADLKRLRKAAARIPREEIAAKGRFCHIIENQKLSQVVEAKSAQQGIRIARRSKQRETLNTPPARPRSQ